MTVAELKAMLADLPDATRVLIFDESREDVLGTLAVNCVLTTGDCAILHHDVEEAERQEAATVAS